jgi:cytochrome c-type biogenesis protein
MISLSLIAAFIAGLLSFLSPCVLPLVPAFLSYLAGTSGSTPNRWKLFSNSLAYVLGFASVFALLGVLLNTVLGPASYGVQLWLARIGGAFIIVFGLHLTGLLRIPWLEQDKKIAIKQLRSTHLTSFLFGAAFAVGWTPCVGPVLGSVLALAATQPGQSFALLLAYALGLGIPFLLVGLFSAQAITIIRKYRTFLQYFNIVVGVLLIVLGILVFTQTLNLVISWIPIGGFS